MTAFSGTSLYLAWVYSGGTITLQGDYRSFNYAPAQTFIDATAGADSFREFLSGVGEPGDCSWSSVMQQSGTALITALARATSGTLLVGVEGTSTNKPKIIIPAISKGPNFNAKYNDIVEFSCSWQQTAAETYIAW